MNTQQGARTGIVSRRMSREPCTGLGVLSCRIRRGVEGAFGFILHWFKEEKRGS